ncbi:MAG TPA: PQQ-binding-like beta-propeller repeat protein [Planctomycetota bacterium]
MMLAAASLVLALQDWPRYRGPNNDDVSTETGLLKSWPADGPPLLWTYRDAGVGYSGPALVAGRLYTLGGRGDAEVLVAVDVATGKEAWTAPVGPLFQFEGNKWSAGPSATPTVSGGLVYALGGNGDLVCVNATSGAPVWRKNLPKELDAQVNPIGGGPKNLGWGFTWSPLVDGERLICLPGGPQGAVAALDRKTGRLLWRSAEVKDQAAYASPVAAEFDGTRQYVALTNAGLFGVSAADGRLLWRAKRESPFGTEVVNSPLIQGAHVYTTVAVNNGGCELVKVSKDGAAFKAEPVYANKNLQNHHGNAIRVGEHVYGYSQGRGWVCQRFLDGMIAWEEKAKLGSGALAYADGRLYCFTENDGTTALVEADPAGWSEKGRLKLPQLSKLRKPSGKLWTPPVVAGGRLYLRDQELLFCFDVKLR